LRFVRGGINQLDTQESRAVILRLAFIIFVLASTGCVRRSAAKRASSNPSPIVVEKVAEGTEEYCWDEPRVKEERNGPGVDLDGHWYHSPHVAVREVKMGRWRPCGELKNN
jgi:hypothetical protein